MRSNIQNFLLSKQLYLSARLYHSQGAFTGVSMCEGTLGDVKNARPLLRPDTVLDYLIADKYFLRDDDDLSSSSGSEPESDASGSNSESERVTVKCKDGPYYHMFHADVDEIRISVPTAHVYGTKDPWRKHSIDLVELCHRAQRLQFQHDGGHEIPRESSDEICDLFEELAEKAEKAGLLA